MSSYLSSPIIGQLQQMHHVLGYLKLNPKVKLRFDNSEPVVSENVFEEHEWQDFCEDAKEAIPTGTPEPRNNSVTTHFLLTQIMQRTK